VKHHGIPKAIVSAIVSDRGSCFKGNFMTALLDVLGTQNTFQLPTAPKQMAGLIG
jgi:hypothetical protein